MIYVLTYPETIWERLLFHLRNIAPSVQCINIRTGPGVVECITGEDSCIMLPMGRVMSVVWDSGYKQAFDQARKEYFDGMAESMKQIAVTPEGCDCDCEGDCDCSSSPYAPSSTAVDGYN